MTPVLWNFNELVLRDVLQKDVVHHGAETRAKIDEEAEDLRINTAAGCVAAGTACGAA